MRSPVRIRPAAPETKRPAPKGAGLLLCGMDHLNTVQVFVMVMMPTMIALMMPAM